MSLYANGMGIPMIPQSGDGPIPSGDRILSENGDFILSENGEFMVIE